MSSLSAITLNPIEHIEGSIRIPGSKSLSNRALLLATLAEGTTRLQNLLDAEDVHHMLDSLKQLGITITPQQEAVCVQGTSGDFPKRQAVCFLGNSGTSMRSLAAALCIAQGDYILEGIPRMYERPIADLVEGLKTLGANIDYLGQVGYPPLHIHPSSLTGGAVSLSGSTSSQYVSAVLMLAPYAIKPVTITIAGKLISKPYVQMTLDIMEQFGVKVEHGTDLKSFEIPLAHYTSPGDYWIESDASSASYFLAAAAIANKNRDKPVRVEGIGKKSLQGDSQFARVLEKMGADVHYEDHAIEISGPDKLRGIDIDMNDMPDVGMTLAMVGLFAEGPTTIHNIASWKVKETDRLHAMATELRKVGATIESGDDWIRVTPPATLQDWKHAEIETYNDHRIAMCFSLVALGGVPVTILNPSCTAKTFPTYFKDFKILAQIE